MDGSGLVYTARGFWRIHILSPIPDRTRLLSTPSLQYIVGLIGYQHNNWDVS